MSIFTNMDKLIEASPLSVQLAPLGNIISVKSLSDHDTITIGLPKGMGMKVSMNIENYMGGLLVIDRSEYEKLFPNG